MKHYSLERLISSSPNPVEAEKLHRLDRQMSIPSQADRPSCSEVVQTISNHGCQRKTDNSKPAERCPAPNAPEAMKPSSRRKSISEGLILQFQANRRPDRKSVTNPGSLPLLCSAHCMSIQQSSRFARQAGESASLLCDDVHRRKL